MAPPPSRKVKRDDDGRLVELWCTKHSTLEPVENFYDRAGERIPKSSHCKEADRIKSAEWREANPERSRRTQRVRNLRKKGVTPEWFDFTFEQQNGRCAICGLPPEAGGAFHVDHDRTCCPGHKSCGECLRGLLCQVCNIRLLPVVEQYLCDPAAVDDYLNRFNRRNTLRGGVAVLEGHQND